ncbi:uncharacterized protein MELLADRAFT_60743 [Melampsora larici-populina 98AG31]|uniref:Uncharacterized protein n=1 Tax=Melampsora larici-populina (strain 98AG31 / pathotype 3-4-7) TaxID=747676 RepID=F4RCP0_MELLP|nr:uncharacterized protein MELLADRAFT_60743 [Melampsora larici-populina 98AG31]EGG09665.1 hypothetical protein MELLADRAFT_60743 [Melampsora larici-populina 98AG31]
MVVPTLLNASYLMVDPHPYAQLPIPRLNGLVGLRCPKCFTAMVYKRANQDSWLIGCPTPSNSHNWKTWRCDQLNHEIALINLGEPRPIVSTPEDWGPRVSPFGEILEPELPPAPKQAYHPYASPRTASYSPTLAQRAKTNLQCKRFFEGVTSQNHKKTANKECPSQFCRGCCVEFGSPACRVHPRVLKNPTPQRHFEPTTTHEHPSLATTSSAQNSRSSKAPASQARPHQWAQTSNSLGRRLDVNTHAMIQQNRAQREQEAARQAVNIIDQRKMVTIYLWVDELESRPITAMFPQWPTACLNQSPLLVQAVVKAVGPQWNQALTVWDTELYAWRETLVNYPHRYQTNHRSLVVRLENVKVPMSAIPSSLRPPKDESSIPPLDAFWSNSELPPICDMPSTPPQGLEIQGTMESVESKGSSPSNPSIKLEAGLDEIEPSTSSSPVRSSIIIDLLESPAPPASSQFEQLEAPTVPSALKKRWPGSTVLVSSLLAWYKDTLKGNLQQKWTEHFGAEWRLCISTVYRYHLWIGAVECHIMEAKFRSQPQATVGEARNVYQKEFKKVASLSTAAPKPAPR